MICVGNITKWAAVPIMGKGLVDLQSMGQRIKHLRCSMNYTQERFAAQINISCGDKS